MRKDITYILDQISLSTDSASQYGIEKTNSAVALESEGWEAWVEEMFGYKKLTSFSRYQRQIWEWAWDLKLEVPSRSLVAILPRGSGKTSTSDMTNAMLLAKRSRLFIMNVASTQVRAESRIKSLRELVSHSRFKKYYPNLSEVQVSSRGQSQGWTNTYFNTRSGQGAIGTGLFARRIYRG
jgi:hypothetical protein